MNLEDRESLASRMLDFNLSTDEDTENDVPGQDSFTDEEPTLPSDLEWLEEFYEEDDGDSDSDLAVVANNDKKRSYAETARMFKLRRNLDQLDCIHQQKEHDVLKAREMLKLCHENIERLLGERDNLEREIEQQKEKDNVAVFRLRAPHKQLCQKLLREEELEGHINTMLKQREQELNEVEVELGRFSSLRQEVQEEEQLYQSLKAQKAATRLQQERKAKQNLQFKIQHLRDKQATMLKKEETECQRKVEEAQANRKIAAKYLKQTIKRMHQQEAEKKQKHRELVEKRIQAVKSLKSNIAATQESLRVQQGRAKANAQKKEQQQRQLRESLQAQGINSTKHMYQQKQLEKAKRKQEEFKESQKSKRVDIVAKVLQEEQLMKSRKKNQQPPLPKSSTADKLTSLKKAREKLLYSLEPIPPAATEEKTTIQSREFRDISSSSSSSSDVEDREEMEETIQQEGDYPSLTDSLDEFSGLWDQYYKVQ